MNMEAKRVFDRNTMRVLMVLGLINLFVYVYIQIDNTHLAGTEELWKYFCQYRKIVSENQSNADKAKEYAAFHDMDDLSYANYAGQIYDAVLKQWDYIMSYDLLFEKMDEEAQRLSMISIFSDPNSLSNRNILKTIEDLRMLRNLDLTVGYDKVTQSVLEYREIQWLSLIFIIYLVYRLMGEQKRGGWRILHSTVKGRWQLCVWRVCCLLLGGFLYNLFMFFSVFSCGILLYGDWGELNRTIQSLEILGFFPYSFSVFQYWVWYIGMQTLGSFLLALVLCLLLQLSRSWMVGLGFFGVLLGLEYVIWENLSGGSKLFLLKFLNLFCCVVPGNSLSQYCNVQVGNKLFSCQLVFLLSVLALSIMIIAALVLLAQKQKGPPISSNIDRIDFPSLPFWKTHVCVSPIWVMELKKMLWCRFGFAASVVLLLLFYVRTKPQTIYYSEEDNIVNQFYEEYGTQNREAGERYIRALEVEIERERICYLSATEQMKEGRISSDEYIAANTRWESFKETRLALDRLRTQETYLETLQSERDISGRFVNPRGYGYLIGLDGKRTQSLTAIFLITVQILFCADVCAGERDTGFKHLAFSTKMGRREWLFQKGLAIGAVAVFLWASVAILDIVSIHKMYGLYGLDAPAQSIELLQSLSLQCSLGEYIGLFYLCKLGIFLGISSVVIFLSVNMSAVSTALLASAVCFLPEILAGLGFRFWAYCSILRYFCITDIEALRNSLRMSVIMMICGGGFYKTAQKKWCKVR